MRSRLAELVRSYPELLLVALGAVVGLVAHRPVGWLADHHGIDVLLAVLVLATGLTVSTEASGRLRPSWPRIVGVLLCGATVLPALSWAVARLVAEGPLRDGMLTVGLAPCEIASVATTALAGGETIVAAAILVGSTLVSIAIAGPILAGATTQGSVRTGPILVTLGMVVALPLIVGLVARRRVPAIARHASSAGRTAVVALVGLVALVAAHIHVDHTYVPLLGALVLFFAGSVVVGGLLGLGAPQGLRSPVLLTVSMRDFAVAAGLATAAFGSAAAAPLGIYGVVVLLWGTFVAGRLRRRAA
jgi:predicted Na+-dependent transporter